MFEIEQNKELESKASIENIPNKLIVNLDFLGKSDSNNFLFTFGFVILLLLGVYFLFNLKMSDKYVLFEKGNELYRFNEREGAIALIKPDLIIPIQEIKTKPEELKTPKIMNEISIPTKKLKLNMQTSWRDNRVYYIFEVSPLTKEIEKIKEEYFSAHKGFTISLKDENGFALNEIFIPIDKMTSVVNEKGKAESLVYTDSKEFSLSVYQDFATWDAGWTF